MGFSRFRAGIALRTVLLFLTVVAVAEMLARTQWYLPIALCVAAALIFLLSLSVVPIRTS